MASTVNNYHYYIIVAPQHGWFEFGLFVLTIYLPNAWIKGNDS